MNASSSAGPLFELPPLLVNAGRYMWKLFEEATGWSHEESLPHYPTISPTGIFPISRSFGDLLKGNVVQVAARYNLPEGLDDFRKEEPLACCFYLINSLHETLLSPEKLDKYKRYPYKESIQFANGIIEKNYCQDIFNDVYKTLTGRDVPLRKSEIFWSHDIDYLHSAWKTELILSFRTKKFHTMPKTICDRLCRGDRWNNIDSILHLEKEYKIRSVYFWLALKGKADLEKNIRIDHADYSIDSRRIEKLWDKISGNGSINGLHKSAFDLSFKQEINLLPGPVKINRNHFLAARFPDQYYHLQNSGLQWDATLGFAEIPGFRNSFGRPFRPYNLQADRPFDFYEIPLHLMDTTLTDYGGMNLEKALKSMKEFIFRHRENTVIGLLLHNSRYSFRDPEEISLWHNFYSDLSRFPVYLPR